MLLLRLIVTLGVCWAVKCDLLDLYVQHMDETMRTMFYRGKRHPMDPASRVKRSLTEMEPVLRVGNFKKQRLNFDEDWLTYWKAHKKMYYKNDALDFPNKREENLDPDQHEILSSNFEKPTTTTPEGATEANASILIEIAKSTSSIAANKVQSIIPHEPMVIEDRGEELKEELPVVQEQAAELDELAIGVSDSEERLPVEDSKSLEMEVENEEKSQFEVISEGDRIDPRVFDDPSFKRPPKSWGRTPKKYFPLVDKLVKDARETESRVKDETVRTKRSPQKQLGKPRFTRYEVLDEDGDVILEWDPSDEEEVTFRVTARTLGYVGIGFNEKSYMKGADILLAWVDDHTGAVNLLVSLSFLFPSISSIPIPPLDRYGGDRRARSDR